MRYAEIENWLREYAADHGVRMDDENTAFLAQELEAMKQRVYEVRFKELKARRLIPVDMTTDRGAESIAWEVMNEVGEAKLIAPGHADDVPLVESTSKKETKLVYNVGSAYEWAINDIWAAAFSGRSIQDRRARTCRRAIERKIDLIGANGIDGTTVDGLVNGDTNSGVPTTTVVNGNWTAAARTFQEIMKDVATMLEEYIAATGDVFRPDTLVIPTSIMAHLQATPIGTDSAMTVLQAMRAALGDMGITQVDSWHELDDVGGTTRAVMYLRDTEVLEYDIPLDFFQMPPERRGIGWRVPCLARVGGVTFHHPQAVRYMDGV